MRLFHSKSRFTYSFVLGSMKMNVLSGLSTAASRPEKLRSFRKLLAWADRDQLVRAAVPQGTFIRLYGAAMQPAQLVPNGDLQQHKDCFECCFPSMS